MLKRSHSSIHKKIYDRIARLGTVSKADLLEHSQITSSSMTRILEEMLSQKKILVSGLGSSTGGRKPILFKTNPTYGYLFGLEISRINSSLGLFDLHLQPLALTHWKMDRDLTPERFVSLVAKETQTMLENHQINLEQVLGLGIGAVGPLDPKQGVILQPDFFPSEAWINVPICDMLERELHVKTWLENGANTALLAEHWALRDETYEHMLYVHAGVNIRSAIMTSGQILRGAADTEGAIGQMIIQTGGSRLRDKGNYGALESYVSVPSLEERVRAHLKMGRESILLSLPPDQIHFEQIIEALNQEDALVKETFTETASYLGIGLANLINTVHPENVILGGALLNAHPLVYEIAIQIARKNIYHYPEYNPIFSRGLLRDAGVVTGAALMVLQGWNDE